MYVHTGIISIVDMCKYVFVSYVIYIVYLSVYIYIYVSRVNVLNLYIVYVFCVYVCLFVCSLFLLYQIIQISVVKYYTEDHQRLYMRNHVSHTSRCYLPIGSVTFFPNMVSCCSYNGLKSECSSLYEHIIFNHQYCIPPSHVQVKPPVWTGVCYRIARLCFHSSLLVSVKVLCLSVHTLN